MAMCDCDQIKSSVQTHCHGTNGPIDILLLCMVGHIEVDDVALVTILMKRPQVVLHHGLLVSQASLATVASDVRHLQQRRVVVHIEVVQECQGAAHSCNILLRLGLGNIQIREPNHMAVLNASAVIVGLPRGFDAAGAYTACGMWTQVVNESDRLA